jgi:hypothetical protein
VSENICQACGHDNEGVPKMCVVLKLVLVDAERTLVEEVTCFERLAEHLLGMSGDSIALLEAHNNVGFCPIGIFVNSLVDRGHHQQVRESVGSSRAFVPCGREGGNLQGGFSSSR